MKPTRDIVPAELRKYVGLRPAMPIEDQWHRAHQLHFTCVTELLSAPDTAFGQMARNAMRLCDETYDLLYNGNFGFIDEPYRAGSRPILERFIAQHISDGMSDKEKAIALNQSMAKAIAEQFGKVPFFLYGETDEEILLKGGGHCSCQGRLLAACCQVIGMQARPVLMWATPHPDNPEELLGGHTGTEIYYDGAWHFFDPSLHWYAESDAGHIPSLVELRENRDIALNMPADKVAQMAPVVPIQTTMDKYIPSIVTIAISRHDVNADFKPHWTWATDEFLERRNKDWHAIKQIAFDLARRGELTDEIYQLDLAGFREKFGITDVNLQPPAAMAAV